MSRKTVIDRLTEIEGGEADKSAAGVPGTFRTEPNNVKYNTWYYGHAVSGDQFKWCVVFQQWCFWKADIPRSVFPWFDPPNVFKVRDWFKGRQRFFDRPMVGDLVIFSRSHIGFVEELVSQDRIQTIEGNSGDRVSRHFYPIGAEGIEGYCRPEYHQVKEGGLSMADVDDILKKLELLRVGDKSGEFDPHDVASLEGVAMKVDAARHDINWLKASVKAIAAKTGATLPPD
jgi:CHAP domain